MWRRDDSHCEEVLLSGGEAEVCQSAFGANDFVIGALMELGLWDIMTGMYPNRLKDENGYNWRILNGVEILRCLLKERKISGANKVLSDARLVAAAGFNLQEEKVSSKLQEGKPVMDSETLGNHLGRIDGESCYYTFSDFTKHSRRRKWIRGKVFAADAHFITVPYGRGYDGMGQMGDAHGYKLEALLSLEENREMFVGFVFDAIECGERALLQDIFDRYEEKVGPIKDMIEILLLDRGYWGAAFLKKLVCDYHIDFVTRPEHRGLDIVKQIFGLIEADEKLAEYEKNFKWKWRTEQRPPSKEHPEGEVRKLKIAGIDGLRIEDEKGNWLDVNAVVVYEHDENGQPIMDPEDETRQLITIYITSLPAEENPMKIRKLYRKRWVIENQGFRETNQKWGLNDLAGRVSMDAMRAHIAFSLMLYNSEKVIRMKFPGSWEKEKDKLKKLGREELVGGVAIIVYTDDGHLGIFTARRFRDLVRAGERKKLKADLKAKLSRALKENQDLQSVLDLLESS